MSWHDNTRGDVAERDSDLTRSGTSVVHCYVMTTRSPVSSFFDTVTDWLVVGGDLDLAECLTDQPPEVTIEQLMGIGVTHVLDLRSEWEDVDLWIENGLSPRNYCYAPIVDDWTHCPDEAWFCAVQNFVLQFWFESSPGDRLYVHCHMGVNRAPSAAMLALLTVEPQMKPWDAFLTIRQARPAAGLVYANAVGARHIVMQADDWAGEFQILCEGTETHRAVTEYLNTLQTYWSYERVRDVNRGVAYYRSNEGGTVAVGV